MKKTDNIRLPGRPPARDDARRTLLLVAGFILAVVVRMAVGGRYAAHSATAGLVFAACLCLLAWMSGAGGLLARPRWRHLWWGVAGATVLTIPVLLTHAHAIHVHARPEGTYMVWALIVSVVAAAEELFLRGVLYGYMQHVSGSAAAVIVTAVLFAGLHLPLYGPAALPLDFAVGLWLGLIRYAAGSWTAPAMSHVLADLAAWWLI